MRPSTPDATHTAPAVTASARGAFPTSNDCTTLLEPGSTCARCGSSPSATHSDPPPNATAAGAPPTGIRTASSRVRSIRETVPSSRVGDPHGAGAGHHGAGPFPTENWAVIRPLSGSISPTAFSPMPGSPSGSSTRMTPNAVTPARSRTAAPTSNRARAGPAAAERPSPGCGVGRRGEVERGILREDRVVQALQLGAGLDADLLHERRSAPRGRPRAPPTGGRSGTARACAAACRRSRSGCSRDERLELADHLGVAARLEVGVDRHLRRAQTELVEAADLRRRRTARRQGRRAGRRARERAPRAARRSLEQALEAHGIDVAVRSCSS